MVHDPDTTDSLLARLAGFAADLCAFRREITRERFLADHRVQYQILFPLQQAIQACVDLGYHLLAASSRPVPATHGDLARALGEMGAIPADSVEPVSRMFGFRNVLVHGYRRLNLERAWEVFAGETKELSQFGRWVAAYLESQKSAEGGGAGADASA